MSRRDRHRPALDVSHDLAERQQFRVHGVPTAVLALAAEFATVKMIG